MKPSIYLKKLAKTIKAYCKECPEYKGKGWCVYPHEPSKKTGPGTGWPKKPADSASKEKCEQLAQNLSSHGGSGGYQGKKKKKGK